MLDLRSALRVARFLIKNRYSYVLDDTFARVVSDRFGLNKEYVLRILEAIRYMYMSFPDKSESWYVRCITRYMMGIQYSKDTWIVKGYRELGDYYPYYYVNFLPKSRKYFCTCFLNRFGKIREKKICTHIGAVILYRKIWRKLKEYS